MLLVLGDLLLGAFLPGGAEPIARRAAELDDADRVLAAFSATTLMKPVPSLQRSSAIDGDVVLAGLAADIGAVVEDDE